MRILLIIVLMLASVSSFSVDCGKDNYDKYWKKAVYVYSAKSIEAKLLPIGGEELIETKLLVLESYKGKPQSVVRTLYGDKWGPLPPVGYTALVFEGEDKNITHCTGTINFELDWLGAENQDRNDFPQKLIKKIRAARSEKP